MSVPWACSIIDSHLRSTPRDTAVTSNYAATATASATRASGRAVPPLPTLPAFYVHWRDGPSPYDPHMGDYRCAALDVLESGATFDLQPSGGEAGSGRKVDTVLAELRDYERDGAVGRDGFRTVALPATVTLARDHCEAAAVYVANPLRDRLALEHELEVDRTRQLAKGLHGQRQTLYERCVRDYPHGALGLRETPYGAPGDVYAAHQRLLHQQGMRDTRALLRLVPGPEDHLRGHYVLHSTERLRGIRCDPPPDHMLGGVRVVEDPDASPPCALYQNSSALFYVST